MITGRALGYQRFKHEDLKSGVRLDPPVDAFRAYISAENVTVRWAYSIDDQPQADSYRGMPLEPGHPEEFDTDLKYLWLWSGGPDAVAHVYYFRSS